MCIWAELSLNIVVCICIAITMTSNVFVRVREGLRLRQRLSFDYFQQNPRVRFIRTGEELYLEGADNSAFEGLIEDPSDIIEFDRFLEEGSSTEPLDIIELDTVGEDIPLTEFAATPGLAEAGGISAAGAAAAPSAGTVVTGVAVAGTAIAVGTTVGIITGHRENEPSDWSDTDLAVQAVENAHNNPIVSVPGHHYIGPGNTVDSGVEPVDQDDFIALQHDLTYGNAETQEAVNRADEIAVSEFANDFIETGNPHSLAGAVGLGAKRTIEHFVGVQYPPNLPSISGKRQWMIIHYLYRIMRELIECQGRIASILFIRIRRLMLTFRKARISGAMFGMLGIELGRITGYHELIHLLG